MSKIKKIWVSRNLKWIQNEVNEISNGIQLRKSQEITNERILCEEIIYRRLLSFWNK